MNKYFNLISYFGGKYPHLKWLLAQFPRGNYHFVDMMCGSANVALNVNYPLVTINDVNSDVINLFTVLRDNYKEFMRLLYFTPFSREELIRVVMDNWDGLTFSDLEKARRFFLRSQLGYGANGSQNNHFGMGFDWALQRTNYYSVSNWNVKLKRLASIVAKLRMMQIDNRSALDLFDDVNRKGNILYFDPPYVMTTRKSKKLYRNEVDADFHARLAEKAKQALGFVVVSGYDSPLYDELFSGFCKTVNKASQANLAKIPKRECIWSNYDPVTINGQYTLNFEK